MTDNGGFNHLGSVYDQLCTSYHAIDDFRAKLLGFLPLVTGGGLVLLTGRPEDVRREFFGPVGLFGIAVTTGLLAYEIYGIRKCRALIIDGKALEEDMQVQHGQFMGRPDAVFRIVNKPFAAGAIYPAVLAAWTYLALYFVKGRIGEVVSAIVFFVGFAGILLYDLALRKPDLFLFTFLRKLRKRSQR
jgi:hypothetical protein